MEVRAVAKFVRVQPRKVRIIADEVRGKQASYVVSLLRYHPSKSATLLRKVVMSAMANAMENHNMPPETLKISAIKIDEGPRMKRLIAKAMGRGARIVKKTSHITVVVSEMEAVAPVKPHGTKAKARPKFEQPAAKKGGKKKADAAPVIEEPTVEAVEEVVEAPAEVEATEVVAEAAETTEPEVEVAEEAADAATEEASTEEKGAE